MSSTIIRVHTTSAFDSSSVNTTTIDRLNHQKKKRKLFIHIVCELISLSLSIVPLDTNVLLIILLTRENESNISNNNILYITFLLDEMK